MTPRDYLKRKCAALGMHDDTGKYVSGRVKSHRRRAVPKIIQAKPVDNPLTRGLTEKND